MPDESRNFEQLRRIAEGEEPTPPPPAQRFPITHEIRRRAGIVDEVIEKIRGNQVLTIGHSRLSWEVFTAVLQKHGVWAVADVRTTPYSKIAPWAKRHILAEDLPQLGVKYHYLGQELGGEPGRGHLYHADGSLDHDRYRREETYQAGMARLIGLIAQGGTVCVMCAEESPERCHRKTLIGRDLQRYGVQVRHLRAPRREISEL